MTWIKDSDSELLPLPGTRCADRRASRIGTFLDTWPHPRGRARYR